MVLTQPGENEFLAKLTEITLANLANEQFGVSELAREIGMSRSNLHRKVKSIHGTSVSQFINQVRLKRAMELLTGTSSTISEVAFECGFHSVSYFNRCFHDFYGYPPGQAGKGEVKEQPVENEQDQSGNLGIRIRQRTLIIIGSSLFVIATVVVLIFIFKPFAQGDQPLDKSIAVLPFKSLSEDPEKQYLADGVMEAILLHLSKIENLRVLSRTSTEQYRGTDKTATTICRELDVSYLLEGSFQKYGDQVRLILQLIIPGKEGHAWAREYDRQWGDIFEVQSEVAQLIAGELMAIITPEEKQLIEKIPTTSLTAYDFFQRGKEAHLTFLSDRKNTEALDKAEDLYQKAIDHDSLFALAYAALAFVNLHKYEQDINRSENCLDSVLILADIAFSIDDQAPWAYCAVGWYHFRKNHFDLAIEEFNKALEYDPNNGGAYEGKAWIFWFNSNYIGAIDNFEKVVSLDRGQRLPEWLKVLGDSYCYAGFQEKAQYYYRETLKLDDDSMNYFFNLASSEHYHGNYPKAIEILQKIYLEDSLNTDVLSRLGYCFILNGQIKESFKYMEKYIERKRALGQFTPSDIDAFLVGYYYWRNGDHKEANYYFTEAVKEYEEIIRTGFTGSLAEAYMSLAAIHAFRGEEDQAYEYLRLLNQLPGMPISHSMYLKNVPLFDSIRDKPEFKQIFMELEAKYQAEHERVKKWLEEREML
jgi:TolB-like protein/AraC-like DNA-binding protein/lipopolysaccharide biosynthesis regulator YciM